MIEDKTTTDINDNSLIEKICTDLYHTTDEIEVVCSTDDYVILNEERIGKKYKVISDYNNTEKMLKENAKLKIFDDRGFKFGDYIELLFSYDSMLYYSPDEFLLYDFKIDNVAVSIDNPSLLFDITMKGFGNDKYYDTDSYHTISLKGITEDNYEEYMAKALFIIGYYNPSINDERYPECFEFLGEDYYRYAADEDEIDNRREACSNFDDKNFENIKYFEALSFYNEGKRLFGHEISFQYFYKVLEHFFLVCRQDEFKTIIGDYNSNNNINEFIDKVTHIYRLSEDSQLLLLLQSIETDIKNIISDGYTKGFVTDNTIESFSDALYMYRNTIVHGKSDDKYSVKTPSSIGSQKETFWNYATEKIAEKLIVKYCLH